MDFTLDKKQLIIQKSAREIAQNELVSIAAEMDKTGAFSREIIKKMGDLDLFSMLIPPEFEGTGLSAAEFSIVLEEVSNACAALGVTLQASVHAAWAILSFGSDEQKKKYLPALAKGEKLATFACTEPSGGSNWPLTATTRAVEDGDEYIVNGSKCFISNAGEAEIYIVMARTNPNKGPMGFSTFIIEKGTEGFSFGKGEEKFGLHGCPTGELYFDNCRIPKSSLLHQIDEGMDVFRASGSLHCVGTASIFVGLSQSALDTTIQYAMEREFIPPTTISHLDSIQGKVAEMAAQVEAARLLIHKAAGELSGPSVTPFFSVCNSCRVALGATGEAVALHGGYGCLQDSKVNRLFRDAKTLSLQMTYDSMTQMAGKIIMKVPQG